MNIRLTILLLISFIPLIMFSQEEISKSVYNDTTYYLLPEYQKKTHNPYPVIWEKEIKLSRQELKEFKWWKRRYFKKDRIVTKFPIDGKWIQRYEEDTTAIAKIFEIKNGLPNGPYKRFNEFGDLVEEGHLLNGCRDGKFHFYPDREDYWRMESSSGHYRFPDSAYYKLAFSPYYMVIDEGKTGEWIYKQHSIISCIENHKQGELHGQRIEYYNDKSKKVEEMYEMGNSVGVHRSWYPNGQIKYEIHYSNDLRNGIYNRWYENGKVKCNLTYKNDTIYEGICFLYYPSGQMFGEGELERNVKIGHWIFFYKTGEKWAEGNYKGFTTKVCQSAIPQDYFHSIETGEWMFWYPNGKFLAKGKFIPESHLISRGEIYVSKKIEKSWEYRDENGVIVKYEDLKKKELLEIDIE